MDGTSDMPAFNGEGSSSGAEPQAAVRALSIPTLMDLCQREMRAYRRGEVYDETYGLELLRRATVMGDQDAWAVIIECFNEQVRGWLLGHPLRYRVCGLEREETYIALAFERFWQATTHQHVEFRTLASALAYLRASLHGAIQDTLRTYSRPGVVPLPEPDEPGEPYAKDQAEDNDVWEVVQSMLISERERRMAYLLYHCGLKPREIVRFLPQEWGDVQEIYRLRRNILERLLRNAAQLRWRLDHGSIGPEM